MVFKFFKGLKTKEGRKVGWKRRRKKKEELICNRGYFLQPEKPKINW
jgi:hypothetical protein